MDIRTEPLDLELKRTFTIAHGASDKRENLLVKLSYGGETGLGEVPIVPYYGHTRSEAEAVLENLAMVLQDQDPFDLQSLEENLAILDPAGRAPHVRAALECACLDLVGRFLGVPLWKLLGLQPAKAPLTSFTLPILPPDETLQAAREVEDFPILKVKVRSLEDLESLKVLRQVLPETILRVDANEALALEDALEMARELEILGGVDLFEQPLVREDLEGLARVKEASSIPVVADESVRTARDVLDLAGKVDGVNLKLAKAGGIRETLAAVAVARAAGMMVMLGCMVESSLGVTAMAHLAPLADFLDLDGPLLLAKDPFRGVRIREGSLDLPEDPGLGCRPAGGKGA